MLLLHNEKLSKKAMSKQKNCDGSRENGHVGPKTTLLAHNKLSVYLYISSCNNIYK